MNTCECCAMQYHVYTKKIPSRKMLAFTNIITNTAYINISIYITVCATLANHVVAIYITVHCARTRLTVAVLGYYEGRFED